MAMLERWWMRALFGTALLSLPLVFMVIAVDLFGSATNQRVTMTFLINLVVAVGLQTFVGNSGIISFAHVALMGIGAYTAALLSTPPDLKARLIPDAPAIILDAHLGFLSATVVALLVTALVGVLVGAAVVRLTGAAAAVATLGLLVIVNTVLSNADSITRGALAFTGIPRHATLSWGLLFAILALLVARVLRESGVGLGLRSSRENAVAAQATGIRVIRARLLMWTASSVIVAAGGSLYAHFVLTLLPSSFYFGLTFLIVTMVIVGGQSVSGALLGAGAITLLAEFLRRAEHGFALGPLSLDQAPGLTTIVLGLLIVLMMILRPRGLLGRWELEEWILRSWFPRRGHDGGAKRTGQPGRRRIASMSRPNRALSNDDLVSERRRHEG